MLKETQMHPNPIRQLILKLTLLALVATAASQMLAQVVPPISESGVPVKVGGGFSNFDVDWAHTRMDGYTLWVDARPPYLPRILDGLNVEIEGRDIRWHPGDKPAGYRQVVGSGGVMYEWRHFRNFRPYAKGLIGFGSIYFGQCLDLCDTKPYTHDTRTVYAPGIGLEYRVFRSIWARADWEYQFWPQLTGNTYLNPQGFTFGAQYDFSRRDRR
jgi:hypothetical protein